MKTFSSPEFPVKLDISVIHSYLTDLTKVEPLIAKFGGDKVQTLSASQEELKLKVKTLGEIGLKLVNTTPNSITYQGISTPVPLHLRIELMEREGGNYGQLFVDADVPPFLAGMVRGRIEPTLNKVGEMLGKMDLSEYLK
ncbi:MAG: hypothetical protein Q3998_01485 [Porphyromonas sp.]|nr:hypothetical protein [Porphyromonas sp.]